MCAPLSRFQGWLHQTRLIRPLLFAFSAGLMLGFMSGVWPWLHHASLLPMFGFSVGCFTVLLSLAVGARQRQSRAHAAACALLLVPIGFVVCGVALQWTPALVLAGPLVALTSVMLVAITLGPRWDHRWLVALGSSVVLGVSWLLGLWAIGPLGVLSPTFMILALFSAAVGGLASEGLRRLLEQYQARQRPTSALETAPEEPEQAPALLSRRLVVLGGSSLLALAASGAGVTWLTRIFLIRYVPLLTYQGHQAAIFSLAWSPDGRRLASASQDGRIQVWDSRSGQTLLRLVGPPAAFPTDPEEQEEAVAWSPDGQELATTGAGQPVVLLSALTGTSLQTFADGWVVAWSPDGQRLASGGYPTKIWDAATGQVVVSLSESLNSELVVWSPDGRYLATADGTQSPVWLWDTSTGALVRTYLSHQMDITAIAWSPNGRLVASGDFAGLIHLWEPQTGRTVFTYRGHATAFGFVSSLAWSPDGRRIVSAGNGTDIQVWQAATGELQFAYRGHQGLVKVVAWSPDGSRIASGGNDRIIQIWQPI